MTDNRDKDRQAISRDIGTLAEDASALMAATADVAGEKIVEARRRLNHSLFLLCACFQELSTWHSASCLAALRQSWRNFAQRKHRNEPTS
jgi:ElaB/YqjD/DUF883 family membrane-anchored ribosome-binding protein